jgi:hypothetical protein
MARFMTNKAATGRRSILAGRFVAQSPVSSARSLVEASQCMRAPSRQPTQARASASAAGPSCRPARENVYLVAIGAVADPTPPVFSAEDLADDIRAQIQRLLAQLEGVSEQEALDQVYRRLAFYLCGTCFRRWIANPTGGCDAP